MGALAPVRDHADVFIRMDGVSTTAQPWDPSELEADGQADAVDYLESTGFVPSQHVHGLWVHRRSDGGTTYAVIVTV